MKGRGRPTGAGYLLITELRGHTRTCAKLALWGAVQGLPAFLSGRLIATAVDHGFTVGRPIAGVAWLLLLGLVYLVSAAGTRRIFPLLGIVVESVRDTLVQRVAGDVLKHAERSRRRPDASGIARLTRQVETVRDVLASILLMALRSVIALVATVVGIASLNPAVLLLVLPPLAVSLCVFALMVKVLTRRQRALILAQEHIAATVTPIVAATRDIAAFGAERYVLARGDAAFDANRAAAVAMARASAFRTIVVAIAAQVPIIVVIVAAPWLMRRGLTIGDLLGTITYLTVNIEPMVQSFAATAGGTGIRLFVALRRIAETLEPGETLTLGASTVPSRSDIELRDVTFAYGPQAKPVLRGLNMRIHANEHVAIAGPSGIGKSTLAMLIAGLERPQQGSVVLGGVPLQDADPGYVNHSIALIPQEAYVFADTLRENLAYLVPTVPDSELDRAVDLLGARPLVDRLGGYDAEVMPSSLSAGEKQLVALVRVYVCPAKVVILDEATCHLDPRLEARVEEAFVRRGGALIVIAHRISSARRASRILLLDGVDAHLGTHDELLGSCSLYADLVGMWMGPQAHTRA